MATLESRLETQLTKWTQSQGGTALKGATNFDTGFPDRLIYLPCAFANVELKGSSKRYHLNDKQMIWAGKILYARQPYYIIESEESLNTFCREVYSHHMIKQPYGIYNLNGFGLTAIIREDGFTTIVSNKRAEPVAVKQFPVEHHSLTIYRAFKLLEEKYPSTNYEDI